MTSRVEPRRAYIQHIPKPSHRSPEVLRQVNDPLLVKQQPSTFDPHQLFWCPFESLVSPDAALARRHSLEWLTRFGFINDEDDRRYVDSFQMDRFVAGCAPLLRGSDLELFSDWGMFTVLIDDHLDTDDPSGIRDEVEQLVRILDTDDPDNIAPDASPSVRILADLWRRSQEIPQPWRRQFADRWAQALEAMLVEASWRRDRLWPSFARYLELRRNTITVQALLRLTDHLNGIRLDDRVLNSSGVTGLRVPFIDHFALVNDVYSFPREASRGDHLNSVFVIEKEYGCTRGEAVTMVVRRADDSLRYFLRLEQTLPMTCDDLGLGAEERTEVTRMACSLRHWFRGNLDFYRAGNARYTTGINQPT